MHRIFLFYLSYDVFGTNIKYILEYTKKTSEFFSEVLLKILEKDPTLSTIQKTGITKKSNELFGEVARQASKSAVKSQKPANVSTSWFQ